MSKEQTANYSDCLLPDNGIDLQKEGPPEGLWHRAHQELNPVLSVER